MIHEMSRLSYLTGNVLHQFLDQRTKAWDSFCDENLLNALCSARVVDVPIVFSIFFTTATQASSATRVWDVNPNKTYLNL